MTILEQTKQLAKAIVADEVFENYLTAQTNSNENKELQDQIGAFNLLQMQLNEEMHKSEKNEEKINDLNAKLQEDYQVIMGTPCMVAFEHAKGEVDDIMTKINRILTSAMNGEDIDTIDFDAVEESGCGSGGCSGCSAEGSCH